MLSTICSVVLSLSVNACINTETTDFTAVKRSPVLIQNLKSDRSYIADRREYESDYSRDANRQRDKHRLRDIGIDRETETHYRDRGYHHHHDCDEQRARECDREYEEGRIYRDADRRRQEIERQHQGDYEYEEERRTPSLFDIFNN